MAGPLVFIFLLAKGLSGKAFTKQASLYLVVSAGLLAILLTASRQFNWLDVLVSTAATLPVVLGIYVGQHMRDKIAPETFKKLVLIAVIAAGADLLRHGFVLPVPLRLVRQVPPQRREVASEVIRRTSRKASRRTSRSLNVQKSRLNKGGCKCPKATG